jgi:VWFA-related protein
MHSIRIIRLHTTIDGHMVTGRVPHFRKFIGVMGLLLALLWFVFASASPFESSFNRHDQNSAAKGAIVTLSVTALNDKGLPVQDLRKEDFSVSEDGRQREIVQFAKGSDPVSVTFVIERGWFHNGTPLNDQFKLGIDGFINGVGGRSSFAMVVCDRLVDLACPLTSNPADLKKALQKVSKQQQTLFRALRDALFLALRDVVSAQVGRKVVVVLTYGFKDDSVTSRARLSIMATSTDASIYVISLDGLKRVFSSSSDLRVDPPSDRYLAMAGSEARDQGDVRPLWWNDISAPTSANIYSILGRWQNDIYQSLADLSGGRFETIAPNDLRAVPACLTRLADELKNQYVISYLSEPAGSDQGKGKVLEVRVARPGVKIRARHEFNASPGRGDAR